MIHVTLNCSSPFVGYSVKTVDFEQRVMREDSKQYLTEEGSRFFNASGSKYLLATFEEKRYFHARNLGVKVFDEQNRRIYTNLAFVGDTQRDARAVDKLALYAMLQEERFYTEFARLIILEKFGYTVRFEEMEAYLKRFYGKLSFDKEQPQVRRLAKAIYSKEEKMIKVVVFEGGDWNYFIKQAGYSSLPRTAYEMKNVDLSKIHTNISFESVVSKSAEINMESVSVSLQEGKKPKPENPQQKRPEQENIEAESLVSESLEQEDIEAESLISESLEQKDIEAESPTSKNLEPESLEAKHPEVESLTPVEKLDEEKHAEESLEEGIARRQLEKEIQKREHVTKRNAELEEEVKKDRMIILIMGIAVVVLAVACLLIRFRFLKD